MHDNPRFMCLPLAGIDNNLTITMLTGKDPDSLEQWTETPNVKLNRKRPKLLHLGRQKQKKSVCVGWRKRQIKYMENETDPGVIVITSKTQANSAMQPIKVKY